MTQTLGEITRRAVKIPSFRGLIARAPEVEVSSDYKSMVPKVACYFIQRPA